MKNNLMSRHSDWYIVKVAITVKGLSSVANLQFE